MHIIRYAGGQDLGGFGNYGSSYHGKGNFLTGIDALDQFRVNDLFKYVQLGASASDKQEDVHLDNLVDMLVDAKEGFDQMI